MRMFEWTPDMLAFMRDASERSSFFEQAADQIVEALGGDKAAASMHVCDAGCGLGYLSLALAKRCRHVTAVDVAEKPLDELRRNIASACCGNVTVCCEDAFALPAALQFDAMIFCMFGTIRQAVSAAQGRSRRVVMLQKTQTRRRFSMEPEDTQPFPAAPDDTPLPQMQPVFSRALRLRLDQPIRSLADGVKFYSLYAKRDGLAQVNEQDVLRRLTPTDDPEFPYLIPATREMTVQAFLLPAAFCPDSTEKE